MIIIGVDPSKGLAISIDGHLSAVITTTFWDIIGTLEKYQESGLAVLVYIENPNVNKSLYAKFQGLSHAVRGKISQGVGKNKRDASLLMEWMYRNKIEYIAVPPRKGNKTKNDPVAFARLTGWTQKTSEHGRDAVMMFWGRSWQYDVAIKRGAR